MSKLRRSSKKRDAILEVIRNTDTHPAADWVYAAIKRDYPDISLGTVYRNIAMFKESGDLITVATVNGQERIDADTSEHAHFICRVCGDVTDLPPQESGISDAIKPPKGARIDSCRIILYGACADCELLIQELPKK